MAHLFDRLPLPHRVISSFMEDTRNWEYLSSLFPLGRTYTEERSGHEVTLLDSTVTGYLVPTGTVTRFGVTTAPSGWLVCNGSAVSRTTYADLFALIGTTYGAGDGSTTFNVPNLTGATVTTYIIKT